jgi:hypothetical protein
LQQFELHLSLTSSPDSGRFDSAFFSRIAASATVSDDTRAPAAFACLKHSPAAVLPARLFVFYFKKEVEECRSNL